MKFIKNIIILMSGTMFAQIVNFVTMPILSRIYTATDFALLGFFSSICSIFNMICSGKYEQGLLLMESDSEVNGLIIVSSCFCFFTCFIIPSVIFFISKINITFQTILDSNLVLLVCVFVLCFGLSEVLRIYFLRNKLFSLISSRVFVVSLITITLNLVGGLVFSEKKKMLVISTTVAQIIGFLLFLVSFISKIKLDFRLPKISELRSIVIKYRDFPLFMLPGQVLSVITGNLPIFILSNYYSQVDIGHYSFVHKVLAVPMTLIGTSIQQVYLQRFSGLKEEEQRRFFRKTSITLFFSIIIPAVICVIFARELFLFFFGTNWESSADLARLMTPMFILQFVTTPVSGVSFIMKKKLNLDFRLQFLRLLLTVISFIIARFMNASFYMTIIFFSVAMIVFYIVSYVTSYKILRN